MDLGLAGKKVAITGGSRGIGRAIVTRLLDEGASVSLCARGQEGVDEAIAELSSHGTVIGAAVDVGDGAAEGAGVHAVFTADGALVPEAISTLAQKGHRRVTGGVGEHLVLQPHVHPRR